MVEQTNTINTPKNEFILKIWKTSDKRAVNVPRKYFLYLSGGVPKTKAKRMDYRVYGLIDEESKCIRFTVSNKEPDVILDGVPFSVALGVFDTFRMPIMASKLFQPGKYRARLFRSGSHYFVEVCADGLIED